jgi:hypothetical protein
MLQCKESMHDFMNTSPMIQLNRAPGDGGSAGIKLLELQCWSELCPPIKSRGSTLNSLPEMMNVKSTALEQEMFAKVLLPSIPMVLSITSSTSGGVTNRIDQCGVCKILWKLWLGERHAIEDDIVKYDFPETVDDTNISSILRAAIVMCD